MNSTIRITRLISDRVVQQIAALCDQGCACFGEYAAL
jgi:hypothetical protein